MARNRKLGQLIVSKPSKPSNRKHQSDLSKDTLDTLDTLFDEERTSR
jgi:hypothetical protein